MNRYDYHRPRSLAEAQQLMVAQPDARFVAGGTDLLVQLRKRNLRPSALISLRNIAELQAVDCSQELRVGAGVPVADIAALPEVRRRYPALVESILVLGSRQIRNVATLAGNLCNASPAADTAVPLLVYDAEVQVCAGSGTTRRIPIAEFFDGPGRSCLASDEIVTEVVVPRPGPTVRAVFLRRGRVKMDLAIASLAVLVERRGSQCVRARVAVGAVAPTPRRLLEVEQVLEGSSLDEDTVARAAALTSELVSPITDLRSTAEYRRTLVGVYLKRAIERVVRGEAGQ